MTRAGLATFTAAAACWAIATVGASPADDAQVRDDGQSRLMTGTARVSGVVMTTDTTAVPVRRAVVTLRGDGPANRAEITGDDGRFTFEGLPAGRFDITASRASFISGSYGARRPGRPGSPLVVEAGAAIDDVTVWVARGGSVTGTVRDGAGTPVPGVDVIVLPVGENVSISPIRDGRPRTDDRGMYRAFGLLPGRYVVVAIPDRDFTGDLARPGSARIDAMLRELERGELAGGVTSAGAPGSPPARPAPSATDAAQRTFAYAPVFHPNTTIRPDATVVVVRSGEANRDVDVTLDPVPTASISGTIVGTGDEPVRIYLSGAGMAMPINIGAPSLKVQPGADGRFEYVGVTPGHYVITARLPTDDAMFARAEVDMAGSDVTGVSLALRPAPTFSGVVQLDPASTPPGAGVDYSAIRLTLRPAGNPTGGGTMVSNNTAYGQHFAVSGQVNADGSFRLPGVLPGAYTPTADQSAALPADWWLRSVLLDGEDLLDVPLDVGDRDVAGAVYLFSNRHSQLSGTVQTSEGRPASGYDVVVLSANRAHWVPGSRRTRSTVPATDGAYLFADLPAGDYLLSVLTDLDPSELEDPGFLEQVAAASVTVTVTDGATTVQHVKATGSESTLDGLSRPEPVARGPMREPSDASPVRVGAAADRACS